MLSTYVFASLYANRHCYEASLLLLSFNLTSVDQQSVVLLTDRLDQILLSQVANERASQGTVHLDALAHDLKFQS